MRKLLLGALIITSSLFFSTKSLAAGAETAISDLSVSAQLQTDGSADVKETLTLASPSTLNWTIYTNYRNLSVQADGATAKATKQNTGGTTVLTSDQTAQVWVINFQATNILIRHNDRDQFYFKLFENTGRQIYNISSSFALPGTVGSNDLSGNAYAIDGVLDNTTSKPTNNSLLFTSSFASNQSIYTLSASWPNSVLNLNWLTDFRLSLLNLNLIPWMVVGLILPLIALFVLWDLIRKHRRNERPVKTILREPSSYLPPILVGVLVNKKVHPNEIVSLIVDLCQRGYLVIVKKNDNYTLSLRKAPDDNLQNWEKEILLQLFPETKKLSDKQAKTMGNDILFSPTVRDAFDKIYSVVTQMKFFTENPHITRIKYKLFGLAFYFIGAIGLIWVAVAGLPAYLLFPFIALLVVAYFIIKLSPKLVKYSLVGFAKREEWLSFRNSLTSNERFGVNESQNHVFEKILPYAIALNCTEQWAKRFDSASITMARPDWLITYEDSSALDLTKELTDFTGKISESLTSLRGPMVS